MPWVFSEDFTTVIVPYSFGICKNLSLNENLIVPERPSASSFSFWDQFTSSR
ncbi:hypothetical protein [Mesomycoplasma hyopneumoniae]